MTDVYKPRLRFVLLQWAWPAVFVPFFLLFFAALSPWLLLLPPLAFVAIIAYAYFWQQARSYEVRPDGIMIKSGVFMPSQSLLLWNQIQKVEEERGLAGEILDYTTLNVQTMSQVSAATGQITGISLSAARELQKTIEQNMRKSTTRNATASIATSATALARVKPAVGPRPALEPLPIQTLTGTWANGLYVAIPGALLTVFFFAIQTENLLIGILGALFFFPIIVSLMLVSTFIQLATLSYQSAEDWFELKQSFLGQNVIRFRFDRIQNVLVRQTWLAKLAGIADVTIDTGENALMANTSNKNYNLATAIPALALADAQKIKDYFLGQVDAPIDKAVDLRGLFPLDDAKPAKKTVSWVWTFIGLFAASIVIGLALNAFQIGWLNGINTAILSFGGLGFLLAVAAAGFIYEKAYFDGYRYSGTPTTLCIQKGVFGFDSIYVPYSRIQNVFVDQDLFDRLFGLADVHVSTVGSGSAVHAHIDGVSVQTAEKLKKELLDRVKANAT